MRCHECDSENLELFYPKSKKRRKLNFIAFCDDCKLMLYSFKMGKTQYSIREYEEGRAYIKMGENIYR